MNLDALLRVFYLDVYKFEVYDPFSRPQTRILRGIAVYALLINDIVTVNHFISLRAERAMLVLNFEFTCLLSQPPTPDA